MKSKPFAYMVGKKYLYMGNEHLVRDVAPAADNKISVRTDRTTITLKKTEIRRDFLPISEEKEESQVSASQALAVYNRINGSSIQVGGLATTILDTIEKLKVDPKYIDQARAINESAKTLIDMKRLELDMLRVAKDLA